MFSVRSLGRCFTAWRQRHRGTTEVAPATQRVDRLDAARAPATSQMQPRSPGIEHHYPATDDALRYVELMHAALRDLRATPPLSCHDGLVSRASALSISMADSGLDLDRTRFNELQSILHELQDATDWEYPGLQPLTAARSYADAVATWLAHHPRRYPAGARHEPRQRQTGSDGQCGSSAVELKENK